MLLCSDTLGFQDTFGHLVCGLDVSGNPHSRDLKEYLPVLQEAQRSGLKLAVHLAEVSVLLLQAGHRQENLSRLDVL